MKSELVNAKGVLEVVYYYQVTDVEARPHYSNQYLPDTVKIKMNLGKSFGPFIPGADELRVGDLLGEESPVASVDLIGKRLKKDGTPGTLDVTEHLYGYCRGDRPEWVEEIIREILLGIL